MRKALVVFEKEWLELRLQRLLLLSVIGIPPLVTILAIVVLFFAARAPGNQTGVILDPDLIALGPTERVQAIIGKQFAVLFLLLPLLIPSVLGSYAIVGEKRDRTLEPVLATPIRTGELLLGKSFAALFPAFGITLLCAVVFIVGTALVAISPRVFSIVVSPGWLAVLLLDTPLLSLTTIGVTVIASSRVNDPRTAQQLSALLIVPILGLLFGQLSGVLVLSPLVATVAAAFLAALAALVLWVAVGLFQRETILTRWR